MSSKLTLSQVLYRSLDEPLRILNASDFVTTDEIVITPQDLDQLKPLIPYCLDIKKNRILYSAKVNLKESIMSTFHYDYLRNHTNFIVSTPLSYENPSREKKVRLPIFIFSMGRCGSTLLSRLIQNHHLLSISEPDIYTQLSLTSHKDLGQTEKNSLFNRMSIDLIQNYQSLYPQSNIFIKLRAECCSAPRLFLKNSKQNTVFMSRNFSSWAESVLQHFNRPNLSAEAVANFYINSLKSLKYLSDNSNCTHLKYENLINPGSDTTEILKSIFGSIYDETILKETLQVDSQQKSHLDQKKKVEIDKKKLADAINFFKSKQPDHLMEEFKIEV